MQPLAIQRSFNVQKQIGPASASSNAMYFLTREEFGKIIAEKGKKIIA